MDDKSKKQVMLILLLVPVLGFLIWSNIVSPQIKKRMAQREARLRASETLAQMAAAEQHLISRQEEVQKFTSMEWGRNPFFQPGLRKLGPAQTAAPRTVREAPRFSLEGIVWDDIFPYAIINGEVWQMNDRVEGFQVRSITRDTVILEGDGQTIELKLFPEVW